MTSGDEGRGADDDGPSSTDLLITDLEQQLAGERARVADRDRALVNCEKHNDELIEEAQRAIKERDAALSVVNDQRTAVAAMAAERDEAVRQLAQARTQERVAWAMLTDPKCMGQQPLSALAAVAQAVNVFLQDYEQASKAQKIRLVAERAEEAERGREAMRALLMKVLPRLKVGDDSLRHLSDGPWISDEIQEALAGADGGGATTEPR